MAVSRPLLTFFHCFNFGQIFKNRTVFLAKFVCLVKKLAVIYFKGLNVTLMVWQYVVSRVGATIFSPHMLLFLGILVHFTTLRALFQQTTYAFLVSGKTVLTVKGPTAIIAVDMGRLSFLIISALPFFLRHMSQF